MPRSDLVLITQRCEAHNMKLIKEPLCFKYLIDFCTKSALVLEHADKLLLHCR